MSKMVNLLPKKEKKAMHILLNFNIETEINIQKNPGQTNDRKNGISLSESSRIFNYFYCPLRMH